MLPHLPGPPNNQQHINVPTPDGDHDATSNPLDYGLVQSITRNVNLEKEFGTFDHGEDDHEGSLGGEEGDLELDEQELEEPRPSDSLEQMHLAFVKKEEQHAIMRKLYHEGKMLPKSDDIVWSLK
jgi:hypothetical protein